MLLDLINILNSNGASIEFESDLPFENMVFFGVDYEFSAPMHIKGSAVNIGGEIELCAHVEGGGKTACARCTKPLDVRFSYDFTERLSNKDAQDVRDEDKIILTGSVVDISDLAMNHFLMQAPMRYLCKPDCKGLCQYCGADRNVTDCGCGRNVTDPRLSVLDDMFKD